ncbi:MAG TPA: peptide deformylase [Bacteroidota bacterium]|nr:peptide deformylase [Bacteroidota bacterium]
MSIRPVLLLGDPLLRAPCARIRRYDTPDLASLIGDLADTLAECRRRHGFGRGLAAPQIGDSRRVIYLDVDAPLPLVNPEIIRASRQVMTLWDDCFSFPDLSVKLKRHLSVEVRYRDAEGKEHTLKARGSLAELLQHEIDHVNGVLAIDRAVDSRHIVYTAELKKLTLGTAHREM